MWYHDSNVDPPKKTRQSIRLSYSVVCVVLNVSLLALLRRVENKKKSKQTLRTTPSPSPGKPEQTSMRNKRKKKSYTSSACKPTARNRPHNRPHILNKAKKRCQIFSSKVMTSPTVPMTEYTWRTSRENLGRTSVSRYPSSEPPGEPSAAKERR